VNISVIDDLFMHSTPCKLSECKLITMHSDDEMFFAAVIRTLEELDPEGDARPITLIMAKYCESSHEALKRFYELSQCVLGRAYELFEAQYSPLHAWQVLRESEWDEGCVVGGHLPRRPWEP
jgi:hypothetical protein